MTLRTQRNFKCENDHAGEEVTRENDQPYSSPWEQVTSKGMQEAGKDDHGYSAYVCAACGKPMKQTA